MVHSVEEHWNSPGCWDPGYLIRHVLTKAGATLSKSSTGTPQYLAHYRTVFAPM